MIGDTSESVKSWGALGSWPLAFSAEREHRGLLAYSGQICLPWITARRVNLRDKEGNRDGPMPCMLGAHRLWRSSPCLVGIEAHRNIYGRTEVDLVARGKYHDPSQSTSRQAVRADILQRYCSEKIGCRVRSRHKLGRTVFLGDTHDHGPAVHLLILA
jgi:hypothetical protein